MEKEAITRGAIGGFIGGIVMAMFAMIAGATYLGTGFFTPMYHIASFLTGPEEMEASMNAGTMFYFSAVPAVLGLMIHMMTAIGWGILFALAVNHEQTLRRLKDFAGRLHSQSLDLSDPSAEEET